MSKIKVIGIGGSGSNAISRMTKIRIKGVDLIALNTDLQDLKKTKADIKLWIGRKISQGLGTGMNPEIGKKAALENKEEIAELLKGADMLFITYGAGGGTGTGAGPVVAEIAKNLGILTVAIVTKPFSFEGLFRKKIADIGIKKLKERVDTLLIIQNDKLLEKLDPKITVLNAFWFCDEILRQAVSAISDLIVLPGIVNVDFADVKSIMKNAGTAIIGIGKADGDKRAEKATLTALNSPLLDISFHGAKGVLFNVASNKDISLLEIEEIANFINQRINPGAKLIFGAVQDGKLKKGEIKVTIIGTGF